MAIRCLFDTGKLFRRSKRETTDDDCSPCHIFSKICGILITFWTITGNIMFYRMTRIKQFSWLPRTFLFRSMSSDLWQEYHGGCEEWSRGYLPLRGTSVYPGYLFNRRICVDHFLFLPLFYLPCDILLLITHLVSSNFSCSKLRFIKSYNLIPISGGQFGIIEPCGAHLNESSELCQERLEDHQRGIQTP